VHPPPFVAASPTQPNQARNGGLDGARSANGAIARTAQRQAAAAARLRVTAPPPAGGKGRNAPPVCDRNRRDWGCQWGVGSGGGGGGGGGGLAQLVDSDSQHITHPHRRATAARDMRQAQAKLTPTTDCPAARVSSTAHPPSRWGTRGSPPQLHGPVPGCTRAPAPCARGEPCPLCCYTTACTRPPPSSSGADSTARGSRGRWETVGVIGLFAGRRRHAPPPPTHTSPTLRKKMTQKSNTRPRSLRYSTVRSHELSFLAVTPRHSPTRPFACLTRRKKSSCSPILSRGSHRTLQARELGGGGGGL